MNLLQKIETYDLAKHPTTFTGSFDSRDLVEVRDEAESLRDEMNEDIEGEGESYTPEEAGEVEEIIEAINDLEGEIGEFDDGNTLIPEYEWVEYAQQLAEEIGAVNEEANWPNNCIDWERAARELAMDYTLVDIDGQDYYVRSC